MKRGIKNKGSTKQLENVGKMAVVSPNLLVVTLNINVKVTLPKVQLKDIKWLTELK
jgi:hypothetical protein